MQLHLWQLLPNWLPPIPNFFMTERRLTLAELQRAINADTPNLALVARDDFLGAQQCDGFEVGVYCEAEVFVERRRAVELGIQPGTYAVLSMWRTPGERIPPNQDVYLSVMFIDSSPPQWLGPVIEGKVWAVWGDPDEGEADETICSAMPPFEDLVAKLLEAPVAK